MHIYLHIYICVCQPAENKTSCKVSHMGPMVNTSVFSHTESGASKEFLVIRRKNHRLVMRLNWFYIIIIDYNVKLLYWDRLTCKMGTFYSLDSLIADYYMSLGVKRIGLASTSLSKVIAMYGLWKSRLCQFQILNISTWYWTCSTCCVTVSVSATFSISGVAENRPQSYPKSVELSVIALLRNGRATFKPTKNVCWWKVPRWNHVEPVPDFPFQTWFSMIKNHGVFSKTSLVTEAKSKSNESKSKSMDFWYTLW